MTPEAERPQITGGGYYPNYITPEELFRDVLGPATPHQYTNMDTTGASHGPLDDTRTRVSQLSADLDEAHAAVADSGEHELSSTPDQAKPHVTSVNDDTGNEGIRSTVGPSGRRSPASTDDTSRNHYETFLDMWSSGRITGNLATALTFTAAAAVALRRRFERD